jgi:hypothetical protein
MPVSLAVAELWALLAPLCTLVGGEVAIWK